MIESIVARRGLRTNDRRFPKGEVLADIFSYSINTGAPISQVVAGKYRYFMPLIAQIERVQVPMKGASARPTPSISTICSPRRWSCSRCARMSPRSTSSSFSTSSSTNIRTPTASRRNLSTGSVASTAISWSWVTTRRASTHGAGQTLPTSRLSQALPDGAGLQDRDQLRSVPEVLKVANASILANERQFPKNLAPVRTSYPMRPALVPLSTNKQQAAFLAQRILELHEEGVRLMKSRCCTGRTIIRWRCSWSLRAGYSFFHHQRTAFFEQGTSRTCRPS